MAAQLRIKAQTTPEYAESACASAGSSLESLWAIYRNLIKARSEAWTAQDRAENLAKARKRNLAAQLRLQSARSKSWALGAQVEFVMELMTQIAPLTLRDVQIKLELFSELAGYHHPGPIRAQNLSARLIKGLIQDLPTLQA